MASESDQPAGVTDSYANVERIVFGLVMIIAPILMLGAAVFHPPHGIENAAGYYSASHDHSTGFYVAHTCFFVSAVLFVLAIVGLGAAGAPQPSQGGLLGLRTFAHGLHRLWGAGRHRLHGLGGWKPAHGAGPGLDPTTMQRYIEVAPPTPSWSRFCWSSPCSRSV